MIYKHYFCSGFTSGENSQEFHLRISFFKWRGIPECFKESVDIASNMYGVERSAITIRQFNRIY